MTTTVEQTTEIINGKEYPLTITRQKGFQEIIVRGKPVPVESVTIFESPLGRSRCFTRARPERTPEERAAALRRVQEIAAQAMRDQMLW